MMPAEDSAVPRPSLGSRPGRFRTILLASDLSPVSEPAEEMAVSLARALGASVLVVSVIDPGSLRLPGGRFVARVDQVRERRQLEAQRIVARGRQAGVAVRFLVWEGSPGEGILEAAQAEGADMIVVGSHGRRGLDRLLLGSVSEHVVRNATVPVMVARPGR